MRGDECQRQVKLVPSVRNKPMHNGRNMSKITTLGERLLKERGVKLLSKNGTRMSDDESIDEGLYNDLKVWNPALGS